MIHNQIPRSVPPKSHNPQHGDNVTRLRLVRLQHSTDPRTAAIATAAALLLTQLDRLLAAVEGEL